MSSVFSVKASFDGGDLVKGFNDVKKEVKGIENAGEDAKKSLDQMLQQKNSTSNYRRQLMQLTKQLTDLTVNYRSLSDEEKQSEFGVALAQRIDELTAKASMFKDAMLDVQQSITESASDTANWDAFQQLVDVSTSALQSFTGVAGLSEDSVEELTRTIAAMQTIGAASNTVIKIGNALQKQSALMLGVRRTQELAAATAIKLKTAAEVKGKAATVAATAAQKALNTVAKANPYVLLASAVIALGTALVAFAKKSNEATKAEKARKEAAEEAAESINDARSKEAKSVGEVTAKYRILQIEYSKLDQNDKTSWIKDNATAFDNLGLKINNVNDADQVFVTQSAKVIAALKARAKAEALEEKYKEEVIKAEEKKAEVVRKTAKEGAKFFTADGKVPEPLKEAGLTEKELKYEWGGGQSGAGTYILTPEATKKLQEYYDTQYDVAVKAADESTSYWENRMVEAANEAAKAAKEIEGLITKPTNGNSDSTKSSSSSKTSDNDDIFDSGSLRAAQKTVTELQDKLNRMSPDDKAFDKVKADLKVAEKIVDDIKKKMSDPDAAKALVEQYDEASKKINDIVKEYNIGIIDEETAKKQIEAINAELQKLGLKPIEIKVKNGKWDELFDKDIDTKNLIEQYDEASKKINDIVKEYNIGIIDKETAKKQIEAINTELQKLGLKPIDIKLNPKGKWDGAFDKDNDTKTAVDSVVQAYSLKLIDKDYAKEAIDAINVERINANLPPIHLNLDVEGVKEGISQAMQMFGAVGSLGNVVSSINSVYESFKNLPDAMDEAENGWERFMVGFKAVMQIMNVFTTVLGTINTVMETFTMIQELVTAAKLKDAAASSVKAGADTAAATASTAEATADTAAATAAETKAVADTAAATASTTVATADTAATIASGTKAATDTSAATASGTKAAADIAAATASTTVATADTAATVASGTKAATDIATAAASGTKAAADIAAATASTTVATADTAATVASGTKTATDIAGATASGTKAAADIAAAGAASVEATANTAAAVSGAAKSVSWVPIVGPILAVAAIAAIIGGIIAAANKGKFANGGIVQGASKIGDFNIARVNGGEMILNNRQQANLFNMLDNNRVNNVSASPQNVSFRIQGDTLVGVIDNYNKKRSRM